MLIGYYKTPLVLISILVAILASYTALTLVGRVTHSARASAPWWITGGAFAMGTGIWAMHFIGMLAFRLPITLGYDPYITLLSWLIPIVVSALALWQLSQIKPTFNRLAVNALVMGLGINAMHYIGMAAMRMQPGIVYDPWLVAASLCIAIGAAGASFWIAFSLRRDKPYVLIWRAGSAVVMGVAIAGMHYTGMAAANFPLGSLCMAADSGLSLDGLAVTVIIATVAVLTIALLTSVYDARLEVRSKILALSQATAREREVLLQREREARTEAESARAEAERINLLKDQFLATISHELRTPLNAILGWAQLLQIRIKDEATLREALQTIERNALAQAQLIEDLLDMSRLVSGKVRIEAEMLEPADLLEGAIETMLPTALEKGIRLTRSIDRNTGPILADPTRLQQIMWNLLSNAIKFTPGGGAVQVTLARSESRIEISVADTGVGIRPDFIPYLFDPFRQADASTMRRYGGLGIGLSIVKQLVELHGATISATSAGEGTGAMFQICFPIPDDARADIGKINDQAAPDTVMPMSVKAVDLSGVNILVVDDEADTRQLVKTMLEECQAHVTVANNAGEALARLAEQTPDVLVSDIGMPDMDGIELIRRIRILRGEVSNIPAIALTAFARAEDQDRALQAGFSRYLSKPVDAGDLASTVASLTRTFPGGAR